MPSLWERMAACQEIVHPIQESAGPSTRQVHALPTCMQAPNSMLAAEHRIFVDSASLPSNVNVYSGALGTQCCMAMLSAVAHQMLSAGKGKNAVREFLESHRMGHLLQHEDLHHTLEHLSPPLPGMKKTSISVAVSRFKNRLHSAAVGKPSSNKASSAALKAGEVVESTQPAQLLSSPSARWRCRSLTPSVTGTWGPPSGANAVNLLSQRGPTNTDTAGAAVTDSSNRKAAASMAGSAMGVGNSRKRNKGRLQQGDTSGSTRIVSWNFAEGNDVGEFRLPTASTAVNVHTQNLLVGGEKVPFAAGTDSGEQQNSRQSDAREFEAGTDEEQIGIEYPSAMAGISSPKFPIQGRQEQVEACVVHHATNHRQPAAEVSYHEPGTKGCVEEADWDAPDREIITGFLSMFEPAD